MRAVIGAISGLVATGPMTVAMILLHRQLPGSERYPLPPRQATMKLAEQTGLKKKLDDPGRYAATLLAHFGYGAGVGSIYGAVEESVPAPAIAKSLVYGVLVWAGSYLGLLPVLGAMKPATEHPVRRNALMIAVHVLWGLCLGLLVEVFMREASSAGGQPFSGRGSRLRDVR